MVEDSNGFPTPRTAPEAIELAVEATLAANPGRTRADIKNGLCDRVAFLATTLLEHSARQGRTDPGGLRQATFDLGLKYKLHVWVEWRGKHYDADRPDGCECWADLPFFAERLALFDDDQREAERQKLLQQPI